MIGKGERTYRRMAARPGLMAFGVRVRETDLWIQADKPLKEQAREIVLLQRKHLEGALDRMPGFAESLTPWTLDGPAPPIVREMVWAGSLCGVGPMAAVAGAMAGAVGRGLLQHCREVIVENGGDIFFQAGETATMGIYAGKSPLSGRIAIRLHAGGEALGVCTSSGTVGHSLSLGRADAVVAVARSSALADAAATAMGNRVTKAGDIQEAIDFGREIPGIMAILVIVGQSMGTWGALEIGPSHAKKPLNIKGQNSRKS